jgi:hypothetical protein
LDVADLQAAGLVDPARHGADRLAVRSAAPYTENPPHVIVQKDDAGVPKVVAIEKPAS